MDKVILIEPLRETLEKMKYQTESPGYITVKSGIKHRFDLVCHKQNRIMVIDVRYSDMIVSELPLIKLFGAAFDAGVDRSIMIAIPDVTDATLRLAEQYGITVIRGTEMNMFVQIRERVAIIVVIIKHSQVCNTTSKYHGSSSKLVVIHLKSTILPNII